MNMKQQITTLKKDLRVEKMLHTRLKKKVKANGHADVPFLDRQPEIDELKNNLSIAEAGVKSSRKLQARQKDELSASRRECGKLVKQLEASPDETPKLEAEIDQLREQCLHLQAIIAHSMAVTVWKVFE